MYNNRYVFWLFVGISSVLVSRTTSKRRTDVQCSYQNTSCPSNSACRRLRVGYYCVCRAGYRWRGGQCRDRDECHRPRRCHQNAVCTNTPGSYFCTCKFGYTGDRQNCADIDECSPPTFCDRAAVCENYPGGYNCTCLTGYSRNGTICTDRDVTESEILAASPGPIAGGVLGACAVLIAVVVLVFVLTRRRRKEKSDVHVQLSPPQPLYENVRSPSCAPVFGNVAAVMSPDKSAENLAIYATPDFTYNDHNMGEFAYAKLWDTKSNR